MKAHLLHIVLGICLVANFAAASPASAGGGWARGKGKAFLSVSYSTFGDVLAYATHLYYEYYNYPTTYLEPAKRTEELAYYFEYGISDRLTFGIDRTTRPAEDAVNGIWFIRRNFGRPNWHSSYGLELGIGKYRDWRQINETQFRLGLSWGRGYETRWVDGWAEVDAKAIALQRSGSVRWKVDSTLGIKPNEKSLLYLQMQTGAIDGEPTYTRAVPTYVRRIWRNISLETALLMGVRNEEDYGIKLGTWMEF